MCFHQITKKIIALVTTVCLLVGMMVVPSAAADDVQMYSYNGIELPALPEVDVSSYPYVVITANSDGDYFARFFDGIEYTTTPGIGGVGWGIQATSTCLVSKFVDGVWNTPATPFGSGVYAYTIRWANFDVLNEDGSVYLAASEPVPIVPDIEDGESILEVLNSIFDYDVATFNLLTYGTNRIRYIERYVASILEVISPSEQETALKETTADVVDSYTEQVWGSDGAGFGRESVASSFEVLNNSKDMLDSGVSVTDFFGMFGTYGWGNWFSAETRDDLDTVPKPAVIDDGDDSELSTYEKNLQAIQSFVGGG